MPKDYGTSPMSVFVCVCAVCMHKLDMESKEGKIEYLISLSKAFKRRFCAMLSWSVVSDSLWPHSEKVANGLQNAGPWPFGKKN